MHVLEILDDVVNALNQIPNQRLNGTYQDSYALAAALGKATRDLRVRIEVRGGVVLEPVQADYPDSLHVELQDYDNDACSSINVAQLTDS